MELSRDSRPASVPVFVRRVGADLEERLADGRSGDFEGVGTRVGKPRSE